MRGLKYVQTSFFGVCKPGRFRPGYTYTAININKSQPKIKGENMEKIYYPNEETVKNAMQTDDPLLLLVAHDGRRLIVSSIDDAGEHLILLRLAGYEDMDLDNYFRLVVNKDGADWTFVCPSNYENITNKSKRIQRFYKDGFSIIPLALNEIGYMVGIDIPRRYRRHIDMM